ncbi:glutamate synthase subunit beta [Olsenella sp. KGMB02461]|nr:glutamate synthase subunit beta [Olsenella sp. KGMB02461]
MGKVGGFLEFDRTAHGERPVAERLKDFGDIALPLPDEEQRFQACRCMNCGVAFCQTGAPFGSARMSGCPLHNLIPEWNDLVWRGLWDQAAARMRITNPFPEFTGRVCPALCEAACNLGRDRGATAIKDDERAISDHEWASGGPAALFSAADKPAASGAVTPREARAPATAAPTAKVAVVGSGPSGLACAWELRRRGFEVRVFEKSDAAGGLLRYGIPAMKLPKDVVERRIQWMRDQGIAFELDYDAAAEKSVSRLCGDFDAVVLAAGAGEPRRLRAPGAQLDGVVLAVDYLTASTKAVEAAGGDRAAYDPAISAQGKDVVVIGGGDTGTDCVATALRQGARSVRQLEFMPQPPEHRLPSNPWPEWPIELKVDYGQQEAIQVQGDDPRIFGADTLELLGDETGAVQSLRFARLDWSGGAPVRIEGSEEEIPAQLVLIAMGFTGPAPELLEAYGVAVQEQRPLPATAPQNHRALRTPDAPGLLTPVYVAGDTRSGASLVVSAIADGLLCAREVAAGLDR